MEAKEIDLKQYAIDVIEKINLKIRTSNENDIDIYAGIGLEWTDKDMALPVIVKDILNIKVEAHRISRKLGEIRYLLCVKPYGEAIEIIDVSKSAEEAFAVKDLVDDMIEAFKAEPGRKKEMIAEKAREAEYQLSHGFKTTNQAREEFGLARIDDESMDELHVVIAEEVRERR